MKIMLFALLGSPVFLFFVHYIPDSFWDRASFLRGELTKTFDRLKVLMDWKGKIRKGEELLLQLQDFQMHYFQGGKSLKNWGRDYKYYPDLLECLSESNRLNGTGLSQHLPSIRGALVKDIEFEQKIWEEKLSAQLQFVIVSFTTWVFIWVTLNVVEIPLNIWVAFWIVVLQLAGFLFFTKMLKELEIQSFSIFQNVFKELYHFYILLDIGKPINEILASSNILGGSFSLEAIFEIKFVRMKKLVEQLRLTGYSPKDEVGELIESIWQIQLQNFGKFTKKLQILKFICLTFFFLPAYFLYLVSIFKFFVEQ